MQYALIAYDLQLILALMAVVGAGSVVTHDVPDGAVACGVPAEVVGLRGELGSSIATDTLL